MKLAILAAKLTAFLLRLFRRGASTLPGRVALFFKYDILTRLSRGVHIVCVTGTNGKTTTCALLAHALTKGGYDCFVNRSGANMLTGVTTAFLAHCTLSGKCKKHYAILECDENSLPEMARYLDAEIVAVTNVFRDQLDRFGEVEHTLAQIRKGIERMPGAVLVLNADDPLSFTLSELKNKVLSYGVNDASESNAVSDNLFCPYCGGVLHYRYRTFAQLGGFACTRCAYRRHTPAVYLSEVAQHTFLLTAAGKTAPARTALQGAYNLYNFCLAAAVLQALNLPLTEALSSFGGAFGRTEAFDCEGHTVLLLLVKNPVGLTGCIQYVSALETPVDMAFALNDNDADSRDVSWIWDSDFTPLGEAGVRACATGTRALDMALRLKYDGIAADDIFLGESYGRLVAWLKEGHRDAAVFATYTAMMHMRRIFVSAFGGKQFWE